MNVLDDGEVQKPAPNKRTNVGQEILAGSNIASDGAGLDHGGPFQVLPMLVIGFGGPNRNRDGGDVRVGAESEVRAEHIAVPRPFLHDFDQCFGRLHKSPAEFIDIPCSRFSGS